MSDSQHVDSGASETYEVEVTTKTGDKGTSSLYNGKRLPKSDLHFEALGTLDECNSFIGLAREFLTDESREVDEYLESIQCILFNVCSAVATPLKTSSKMAISKTTFSEAYVLDLEKWSYVLHQQLPQQTSFFLPSGGKAASHLHVARSICRRAERSMVRLLEDGDIRPEVFRYVNRLSDFLYIAARFVAMKEKKPLKPWRML